MSVKAPTHPTGAPAFPAPGSAILQVWVAQMQQGRKGNLYVVPLKRKEVLFLTWPFMIASLGD